MRITWASIVVLMFSLVSYAVGVAQAGDAAKDGAGGFNPVPPLAAEVDKAKEAYEDAQAKRDLAMEQLREARKTYIHAENRMGVKDNAETRATVDEAKAALDKAEADYRKARKIRDDASETFFKTRRAAAKALSDSAPPETPMTPSVTAAAAGAGAATAMSQAEVDEAWHKWTAAQSKAWKAQDAARAAWEVANAAKQAAKTAPTDTTAISAYFDAVKMAQAASDAADAAQAAIPAVPPASGTAPIGVSNPVGTSAVEAKTPAPTASQADTDKADAARAASDAVRAAADDKAWQARIAAQAAADKAAAARAAAKAAPTDANVSAYLDARAAARAAADAADAAKAEADRVWKTAQADPVKDAKAAANAAYAAWDKTYAEEKASAGINGPHPRTMAAWNVYVEAHRAAVTANRAANAASPGKPPLPDDARIWDDGNDPYEDVDQRDYDRRELGQGDEEGDPVEIDDKHLRRLGFHVDPTPAPTTSPSPDPWAAAGAALREAETAQHEADLARREALKARPTKAETDAVWNKAMAAQKHAAAANVKADAALKEAQKNDFPRTQEKLGTSDAVARAAAQAVAQAAADAARNGGVPMEKRDAWKDAQADAKKADAELIAAIDEVGAAQAEAKAAHAKKNTAREDAAWDKWRRATYNRKWARAKAQMREAAWLAVVEAAINDQLRELSSPRAARSANSGDHPHTQERPGAGAPSGDSGWRTPSEGTHTLTPQRAATAEAQPSNEPTLEQLRRAQQLFKGDSGQGGIFVPLPEPQPPVERATIPVPRMTTPPSTQTPATSPTPTPTTPPTPTPTTPSIPGIPKTPVTPPPPVTPPVTPPMTPPTPPIATPAVPGFSGTWNGNGGCGFTSFIINQQGNSLMLLGLPGNGPLQATSNGNSAQAQGAVMFGKPDHLLRIVLSANQLAFQASSSSGSCSASFRRQ